MYLNQFESTSQVRLQQVLATLKDVHGVHIKIDLESPTAELAIRECQSAWESTKNKIVSESSFNSYQQNPQYTKAMLILEAMKMMLTEIGPKRRRKLKMSESTTEVVEGNQTTMSPNQLAKVTALGRAMINYATKTHETNPKELAILNAFSRVGDKLEKMGTAFGPTGLTDNEKKIAKLAQLKMKSSGYLDQDLDEELEIMTAETNDTVEPGLDNVHEQLNESDTLSGQVLDTPAMPGNATFSQAHHYEYQASMARSELYRNAKYAMSMIKQVDPNDEIQPWIAACLTKSANMLDKVFHYLDYYKTFEPQQLPEDMDGEMDLGETSGSIARENLMLIVEYSTKLFNLIQPGDKLEGWVAMKLTTASECISSSKHYMDYVQFEKHAMDDHFDEGRKAKRKEIAETRLTEEEDPNNEQLAKAQLIISAKAISGKIQDMAEDVAKLSVNDLMPLVDSMRAQFGPDAASGFNDTVKAALDSLLDTTTQTKDSVDTAVTTLQGGGIPAAQTDIEQAATEAPPDNTDISADMAAIGSEPAAEEPAAEEPADTGALGRAKKSQVAEAWGTKMHTAEKDKGKWDGYTIAELKSKKANLMKKEERTAAEQKTVRQLNFAIRAKQQDHWGTIKEESNTCKECGTGMYMETRNGKMKCNNCGSVAVSESTMQGFMRGDQVKHKTQKLGVGTVVADPEDNEYPVKFGNDPEVYYTPAEDLVKVNESWDAKMKTAKKDIGKWEGWTKAELEDRKAKLMKKSERSEAEQKEVKQINFAIRAKQKDKWGKIKEGSNTCKECSTGTYMEDDGKMRCNKCGAIMVSENWPGYKKKMADQKKVMSRTDKEWNAITKINDTPPVVEGIFPSKPKVAVTRISPSTPSEIKAKNELPLKKGQANVTQVTPDMMRKELEKNMPASMRKDQLGTKVTEVAPPGEKAEDFIKGQKEDFKKRYGKNWERVLYATAWKKFGPKHEGYAEAVSSLAEAKLALANLAKEMAAHKSVFKNMIAEGKTTDPLHVGYGLEGESIRQQMILAQRKITEQTSVIRQIMQEGVMGMIKNIESLNKAKELKKLKSSTPYGVIYETKSGRKAKKMFENANTRKYWLDLNNSKISNLRMIDPETFDAAIIKKLGA